MRGLFVADLSLNDSLTHGFCRVVAVFVGCCLNWESLGDSKSLEYFLVCCRWGMVLFKKCLNCDSSPYESTLFVWS